MSEENRKDKRKIIYFLITFFVGCLAMYAIVYFFPVVITRDITKLEKEVTVNENGIADAVEKIYDAVVIVSTYNNETHVASGTGFVYEEDDKNYYILTNHHVIEDGNKVDVTFTDGKIIETTVVGSDKYSDIAVLSIKKTDGINIAKIGKSDDARIGDTVFAVGAPLDSAYSWTVTRGILSGKDRMVEVSLNNNTNSSDYVMKVLQTDAAINSGNSGGPLCNSNGEVVGITSLKLVSSGVEGMGFAIPIENAIKKANEIISGKNLEYPYLGVSSFDVSKVYNSREYYQLIKESGLTQGVVIYTVEDDSPASRAGLKKNDIIVAINDQKIKNSAYLKYYLYQYNAKDTIKITVYRDGKNKIVSVKLNTNKQAI